MHETRGRTDLLSLRDGRPALRGPARHRQAVAVPLAAPATGRPSMPPPLQDSPEMAVLAASFQVRRGNSVLQIDPGLPYSKEELVAEIDAGVTTENAQPRLFGGNGTSHRGHSVESRFSRAGVLISGHSDPRKQLLQGPCNYTPLTTSLTVSSRLVGRYRFPPSASIRAIRTPPFLPRRYPQP